MAKRRVPVTVADVQHVLRRAADGQVQVRLAPSERPWDDEAAGEWTFLIDGWAITLCNPATEPVFVWGARSPQGHEVEWSDWLDLSVMTKEPRYTNLSAKEREAAWEAAIAIVHSIQEGERELPGLPAHLEKDEAQVSRELLSRRLGTQLRQLVPDDEARCSLQSFLREAAE